MRICPHRQTQGSKLLIITGISTGENFAYTGTAQKLYRQVLQVLKVLPIADESALMQTSATSLVPLKPT